MEPHHLWGSGRRSAVSFTFDVDAEEVWLADHPQSAQNLGILSQGAYGARRGVDLVLGMLSRYEVRATFFMPGRVAERHPAVLERILGAGHEVASHGYTHRSPTDLDEAENREELVRGLDALTSRGATVSGYRAPAWDLGCQMLALLSEHGITYSANLMDDVVPYRHQPSGVVELPSHWVLDDAPFCWFSSRDWTRSIAPNGVITELMTAEWDGIDALGGATLMTFHPQIIGRPGRLRVLDALLERAASDDGYLVATCAELAALVPTEETVDA